MIVPKSRGENRYRYYDDSHIQRLHTIKLLQDSGFALKEIVAAITPALEPGTEVTVTGQQMAKQIFEALGLQQEKLKERQIEIAHTIEEISRMMTAMQDCFGCKVSSNIEDCAKCAKGPAEVRHLGVDLVGKKNSESGSGDNNMIAAMGGR